MKLATRMGIAFALVSAITLMPAMASAASCSAKTDAPINTRNQQGSLDIINASLGGTHTSTIKGTARR